MSSPPEDLVELEVELSAEESDAEELDRLTRTLQRQLLELDVQGVKRPVAGDVPAGTRAVEVAAIGTLIVALAKTAPALASVIGTIRSWLSGDRGRSVKIQLGGDTLEVTGASSDEQERLISTFIARHAQ